MGLYCNKTEAAKFFGISRQKLYTVLDGVQDEMIAGRYGPYSIAGNLVSKAVVLDYLRYREMLKNKLTREMVPAYNEQAAIKAVGEIQCAK